VDGCDTCGGVWFDVNELSQLVSGGRQVVGWAEQLFDPPQVSEQLPSDQALCPTCTVPLYPFQPKRTPDVTLDACPRCKGIWVDDRELEAIARHMPGTPPAPRDVRCRVRAAAATVHAGLLMCPRCDFRLSEKPADLSNLDLGQGEPRVEHCEACGGVWVDPGSLNVLMGLPANWLEEWQAQLAATVRRLAVALADRLICPQCRISLEERLFGESSDVYVDRCTSCAGTWLDRGELVLVKRVSIRQDVWRNAQ
jgi:Zn-finger nucleic acid-binding protein